MTPMGRCSGEHHTSEQRVAAQDTLTWPPRAARAASHSHGSQLMVTVPGFHGWCSRHSAGMQDHIVGFPGGMPLFKHVIELEGTVERSCPGINA